MLDTLHLATPYSPSIHFIDALFSHSFSLLPLLPCLYDLIGFTYLLKWGIYARRRGKSGKKLTQISPLPLPIPDSL